MRLRPTVLAALLCAPAAAGAVEAGEPAPAVALTDLSGQAFDASALTGRVVVLNFWATWCGPCQAELPLLDAMHRDLGGEAVVVAVSVDTSRQRPRALASRLGLDLPVLFDNGATATAFEPPAMPTTYVIGPDGAVHSVHSGALDASGVAALREEVRSLVPSGP